MRGFQHRTEVSAFRSLIDQRIVPLTAEAVELRHAAGRVLATDVVAAVAVPPFDRAAMDGYALRGEETFGCDAYNPLEFAVVGQAFPARPFEQTVQPGQAVRIMTGAPLPHGADAVLHAEAAEEVPANPSPPPPGRGGQGGVRLRVSESVPPGRNVGRRGEDVQPGTTVLRAGRVLRPQDVAVLAALGASPVEVIRRPTVAILVTGDELLPCGSRPEGFKIVDSNSVMLAALVSRDGGLPGEPVLVPDRRESVLEALLGAQADVLLVSGGSSVGLEDHAPRLLAEVGELSVHGVALRPASPAGVGFLNGRPVFLLPGNPVSCLCAYDLFAARAVRGLGGRDRELPYRSCRLPLARKVASMVGRVDYVRVQVAGGRVEPLAVSGASILSSTTRADGFVLVPAESEGHAPGEEVEVFLYDHP
ncbi:MAG: molybdopterin molybdotransferase MoeA [Gemmataceae bacterium]|nr:molybdopterin molybdotransferase MoeA [Gemmataceae bacterium]